MMNEKKIKATAFILAIIFNYVILYIYFPRAWDSLHIVIKIFLTAGLIGIVALGSAFISAMQSGFSGKVDLDIPKKKNIALNYIDWIILLPLKLFIFTFFLYFISSYYIGHYSKIYHNPDLLKYFGARQWSITIGPVIGLLIGMACGAYWLYDNHLKKRR